MADWVKVAGSLSAISAGSRTTVWGVSAASAPAGSTRLPVRMLTEPAGADSG